jgi:hypothetical protein
MIKVANGTTALPAVTGKSYCIKNVLVSSIATIEVKFTDGTTTFWSMTGLLVINIKEFKFPQGSALSIVVGNGAYFCAEDITLE